MAFKTKAKTMKNNRNTGRSDGGTDGLTDDIGQMTANEFFECSELVVALVIVLDKDDK